MNGYAAMHPVGIDVRADTLESVAGYSDEQFERELAFGVSALDTNDASSCRWLAALLARRIDTLDTFTPRAVTSKDAARDVAIEWQSWMSTQSLSMSEILEWQHYFEELAERFDLTEEFQENGIL